MKKEINSQKELFEKLKPALKCKKHELKRDGINISEIDIWNCNKDLKWKNSHGLTIANMVDNILNLENETYYNYVNSDIKIGDKNE